MHQSSPPKLLYKKRLQQWHIRLALGATVLILLQSLSGAFLSVGKDLQQSLFPHRWTVIAMPTKPDLNAILQQLHAEANRKQIKIAKLYLETDPQLAWQAHMNNGEQWNLNPYTGKITDRFRTGSDLYSIVLQLHRWLLLNKEPARSWARHLTSLVASVVILQISIGFFLGLTPRKSALKRIKLKPHKTLTGAVAQWHLMLGVYAAPLLILIAVCGIGFNWPVIGTLLEWSTASTIERPAKHRPISVGGIQQWPLALKNAQHALPQGQLHRIYFPQQDNQPLRLRYQMPGEFHPYSYVWLDGGSGKLLDLYDASAAPLATRLWNFKYSFHTGNFYGLSVRLAWLLLSLLPSFFTLSGLWLWWIKRKKLRLKKRTR